MSTVERKPTDKQIYGKLGEDAAAAYYVSLGYTVVARNLHVGRNELDLIVENETHLVFVEVKSRHQAYGTESRFGRPASAVTRDKRMRIVSAAKGHLREHRIYKQPRIDIVEVYLRRNDDGSHAVERILPFHNAFGAKG
jgi:putative endonuclease